jgi:predicted permease
MEGRWILSAARQTFRQWRHRPLLPFAAVSSIGAGVAVSAAVFGILNGLLLQQLPVRDPATLFDVLDESRSTLPARLVVPYAEYTAIRTRLRATEVVRDLSAFVPFRTSFVSDTTSHVVVGEAVSGSYFPMLGVSPLLGRLGPSVGDGDALQGVVISARLWRTAFDGPMSVIGATCRLNGKVVRVVGVAPTSFRGLFEPTIFPADVWMPMELARDVIGDAVSLVQMKGRAEPGAGLEAVTAAFRGGARPQVESERGGEGRRVFARRGDLARSNAALDRRILQFGGAFFLSTLAVLFVAAVNLASIFLTQGLARRTEYAVRSALGASSHRLAGAALLEPIVAVAAGTGLGVIGTQATLSFANAQRVQAAPGLMLSTAFSVDWHVWAVASVAACLVAGSASVAPVRTLLGVLPRHALTPARLLPQRRRHGRTQYLLIAAHVCIAVVLLVAATQLGRTAIRESGRDLGFDAGHVAFVRLEWGGNVDGAAQVLRAVSALRAVPAIRAATAASFIPYAVETARPCGPMRLDTRLEVQGCHVEVSSDFFDALGISFLQGRMVGGTSGGSDGSTVVLSAAAASRWWPQASSLGHTVRVLGQTRTVGGVVADVDHGLGGQGTPYPVVYVLTDERPGSPTYVVVRSRGGLADAKSALAGVLRELRPEVTIAYSSSFDEFMKTGPMYPLRIGGIVTGAVAGLAVMLSALGLFSLVARTSGSRTREFAIRAALGASARRLLLVAVGDALVPSVVGVFVGVALAMTVVPSLPRLGTVAITVDVASALVAGAITLLISVSAVVVASHGARRRDPLASLGEL